MHMSEVTHSPWTQVPQSAMDKKVKLFREDCEIVFQLSTYVGHTTALSSQIHNCRIRKLFDMTHVNIQAWVYKYHTSVHNSSMIKEVVVFFIFHKSTNLVV